MKATYKLHDLQYQIFNDQSRFIVLAAGRRFGKTVLAIVKMITVASSIKKALIWYVAPTYKQAKMIAWKMLLEMTPSKLIAKKNEVELEITLVNGSSISLKGADNEDSLRGAGLDFCVMDEFGSMKANVWQEIIRPMLTDRQSPALFIGTPKGKNHFWELWLKGQRKENGFSSYTAKTEMNPYIPKSEIKEAKETMAPIYFRQEHEASFEDYSGLVWPEFKQERDVIEPFAIPEFWESLGVIDPAITGTTASLFAYIDGDGNFYFTGEYYEQNQRVSEIAQAIRLKSRRWLIDPAAKVLKTAKAGQIYSVFDEYMENGIMAMPGENDVDAGINRVAEYFKSGKIKIFSNCTNLIYELERYHWSEEKETVNGIMKPKPFKSMDHLCDCLRYAIMSRPAPSKLKPQIKEGTIAYFERLEENQRQFQERLAAI